MADSAFLFDILDWRSSRAVQRMTFAQRGMFLEMLFEQWDKGSLPDDPAAVADLIGGTVEEWETAWPILRRKFVDRRSMRRDGTDLPHDHDPKRQIVNLRLERTRRERKAYISRMKGLGQKGGHSKQQKAEKLRASARLAGDASARLAAPASSACLAAPAKRTPSTGLDRNGLDRNGVQRRASGHQQHHYCGVNFCVSVLQHEKFFQELGSHRQTFDLDDAYRRWDGENPTIDNLLPWIKARISAEVGSTEPTVGSRTAALQKASGGFLRGLS